MPLPDNGYPPEAYGDGQTLWWHLPTWPGTKKKLGDEPKIAAWLAFNKSIGETFTTAELRKALGDQLDETSRNNKEHFQRRIRKLRSSRDGWVFPSIRHDRTLDMGAYRLEHIGWHPALGDRPKDPNAVSSKTRRLVLMRDGNRCQVCGVGFGEPYPEDADSLAVLTVGHVIPEAHRGSGQMSNLRAECTLCNEPARSDTGRSASPDEIMSRLHNFKREELMKLHSWAKSGHRIRDRVDETYDQIRMMAPGDREAVLGQLGKMLGHG